MWESIKSLLSAGVSNSNSSHVTAWLNSHTPAKSPTRHNRFMRLCSIVLHVAWKREKGLLVFSKTRETLRHCVSKCILPLWTVSLEFSSGGGFLDISDTSIANSPLETFYTDLQLLCCIRLKAVCVCVCVLLLLGGS